MAPTCCGGVAVSVPFELAPGVSVNVAPPTVPSLQMAPPVTSAALVVAVPGPRGAPGDAGDIDLLIARLQDLEDNPGYYLYEQTEPSTVWLISHPLQFIPAGIEVIDHVGDRHYPIITWPDAQTVQLSFNVAVRGTARLS